MKKWHFLIILKHGRYQLSWEREAEVMVFSNQAASKRWWEKYSEVKFRIPANIQLHTYSELNFITAAIIILVCRSNTSKMWKIKFSMNFKNVIEITSVADVDLGYSAHSEGFVFNVKHVPSHSVTCALIH